MSTLLHSGSSVTQTSIYLDYGVNYDIDSNPSIKTITQQLVNWCLKRFYNRSKYFLGGKWPGV